MVLCMCGAEAKALDLYSSACVVQKAKALAQKKEEGNAAFKVGKIQEAYDLYSEALAIDATNIFTNSKLYCNRATVCAKVGLSTPKSTLLIPVPCQQWN